MPQRQSIVTLDETEKEILTTAADGRKLTTLTKHLREHINRDGEHIRQLARNSSITAQDGKRAHDALVTKLKLIQQIAVLLPEDNTEAAQDVEKLSTEITRAIELTNEIANDFA